MIKRYPKGQELQLSTHFNLSEFHCRCVNPDCTDTLLSEELIAGLQKIRDELGELHVNSGYRCAKRNAAQGGKDDSYHLTGMAADIRPINATVETLMRQAKRTDEFSNGGIGAYSWGCHLDVRGKPARWFG